MREERISEIINELDGSCYGKGCNYLVDGQVGKDNMPCFYSRDYCYNISFEDLIKWYIPRLGNFDEDYWDEERAPTKEELEQHNKWAEEQLNLFMELINIYSVYRILSKISLN